MQSAHNRGIDGAQFLQKTVTNYCPVNGNSDQGWHRVYIGRHQICRTDVKEGQDMKYIIAIIQPGKLTAVHDALLDIGITGMTVTEVQGYGRQKGKSEIYRGAEYTVHFLPKIKIELALPAKMATKAIDVIKTASSSGKIGDGKIFTFDLQEAVRIRTSETGDSAL
jgi:nitrogen regulatory protein P-II 2